MVWALGDRGVPPTGLAPNRCHGSPGLPALCGPWPMFEPDRRSPDRDCRESIAHRGAQRRVKSCGLRRKRAGTEGVCLGGWREETVRACVTGALLLRLGIAELHTSKGALIGHRPHVRPSARCDCSRTPSLVSRARVIPVRATRRKARKCWINDSSQACAVASGSCAGIHSWGQLSSRDRPREPACAKGFAGCADVHIMVQSNQQGGRLRPG
jgi:hypothetical protein